MLQFTHAKNPKLVDNDMSALTPSDRAFHDTMRPSWGPDGTLVYAAVSKPQSFGTASGKDRERDGLLTIQKGSVVSDNRDVRFAKFSNEVRFCTKNYELPNLIYILGSCRTS